MDNKPTELESSIFGLLAEREIEAPGDQKELVRDIVALFLPPNLTRYALKAILEQLRFCNFECEAGPLVLNTAFIALEELSRAGHTDSGT